MKREDPRASRLCSDIPHLSPFHDCVNRDKTCASEEQECSYSLSFRASSTLVLGFSGDSRESRVQTGGVSIHRRQVTIRTGAHGNRGSRFDDSRVLEVTVPCDVQRVRRTRGKTVGSRRRITVSRGHDTRVMVPCTRHGVTHETAGLKESSPLRCPGGIRWRR